MKNFKLMMVIALFSSMGMAIDKPYDSTERQADENMLKDVAQAIVNSPTMQRIAQSAARYGTKADHRQSDTAVLQAIAAQPAVQKVVTHPTVQMNVARAQAVADIVGEKATQVGTKVATVVQDQAHQALKVIDEKVAQNQQKNNPVEASYYDFKTADQKIAVLKAIMSENVELQAQLFMIKNNMSLSRDQKIAAAVAMYDKMFPTYLTLTQTVTGAAIFAVTAGAFLIYSYINKSKKETSNEEQN